MGYVVPQIVTGNQYLGHINRGKDLTHLGSEFDPGEIDLIFIDANHKHPYPAIDLLAALPYLRENSVVALHDTNLPLINASFPSFGAKHLFDGITTQFTFNCPASKRNQDVSNMGAFVITDKQKLRDEIIEIFYRHEFEMEVTGPYLEIAQQLQGKRKKA